MRVVKYLERRARWLAFVLAVDVLDVFLEVFRSDDGVIPHLRAVGVDGVD